MKPYKKIEAIQINAVQYGKDPEANDMVETCRTDYTGKIVAVPRDSLGTPKDAFKAVKTDNGWKKITEGDWIVKRGEKIAVVPDDIFGLMFVEA